VTAESVARLMAGDHYAIESESGELVGYFCVGEHARVPGGRYDAAAVDLGFGLRPDLAGSGCGASWARAVLAFVKEQQATPRVRATIATWNKRALSVAARIGFRQVGSFGGFRRGAAGHYVVLVVDA
jgi:RimJ/RimL family protein N-acetyltransferase